MSTTTTVFGLIRGKVLHSIEILGETDRIWKILFRRGFVEDVPATDPRAVNLSVLESMPALGALSALITTAAETRASSLRRWIDSPFFPADVTGLVFAGLLFFVSLPNLPLHVSYTARYLHPWFLVGLYLLVRTPGLTRTFETRSKIVGYSCLVTTFTVLSVYGLLIPKVAHVPSEAVQLHAIPAFFLGMSVVGLTLVQSVVSGGKLRTAVAILMGISFGLVAAYSLETSLIVYSSERNLLPVIELISEQFDYTT